MKFGFEFVLGWGGYIGGFRGIRKGEVEEVNDVRGLS